MEPIKIGEVEFKKCSLLENRILIGIDCGFSLTKFIFLNKENKKQLEDDRVEYVTFRYAIFDNKNVEESLGWLKENAFVPKDSLLQIHGTGVNLFRFREYIESVFQLKLVTVREDLAIVAGHKIAFEQISKDQIVCPAMEIGNIETIDNELFKKFSEIINKRLNTEDDPQTTNTSSYFPCLLYHCGSASSIYYFDRNGLAKPVGYIQNGGKTFLGIAKCLIDTNNYKEIIECAEKGDRSKVDIRVKDVISAEIKSPYGRFPPEMPLFAFGKIAEEANDLKIFTKNDKALSLIGYLTALMFLDTNRACIITRVKRVLLSGNMYQSNLFQREFQDGMSYFTTSIKYDFLKLGFGIALGAMLCCDEDRSKYFL